MELSSELQALQQRMNTEVTARKLKEAELVEAQAKVSQQSSQIRSLQSTATNSTASTVVSSAELDTLKLELNKCRQALVDAQDTVKSESATKE